MAKKTRMERISDESHVVLEKLKEKHDCRSISEVFDAIVFNASDLQQLEEFFNGRKKRK